MTQRANSIQTQEPLISPWAEVTAYAGDVLAELYQRLLNLPRITLADGTTARVEAYYPPQIDQDGERHCGIDVRLSSGDLLEFTICNTGWERSPIANPARPR